MNKQLATDELQFVSEFCKDLNPVLACERMGHDELMAQQAAYDYLGNDDIHQAIAERLVDLKFRPPTSSTQLVLKPEDYGISEPYILVRLKNLADKSPPQIQVKALELLGKHIGMFKEDKGKTENTQVNVFAGETRDEMLKRMRDSFGKPKPK